MSRSGMDRREFIALGAGALAVAALPPILRREERLLRHSVPVMGTLAEIAVPVRNERAAHGAIRAAVAELHRVETLMTRFRSDSDVGRLNAAPAGTRVAVSPETAEVARDALRWAEATGGIFDPCLGALARLWDPEMSPDGTHPADRRLPSAGFLREFAGQDLWRHLALEGDPGAPILRREHELAQLDLGGIAKGFGVDAAARALSEHGVFRALVNVGGDLAALGVGPGGRPWRIGVRDPENPEGVVATLEVVDAAVATSGDYVRFFSQGGTRFHHLLDGATAAPRRTSIHSVTVIGPDARTADAAATAAFGLQAGIGTSTLSRMHPALRVAHAG